MKSTIAILALALLAFSTTAQNKHPMRIAMVSVFVEDPAKAHKYYTQVLGFETVTFSPENYIAIVRSPLDSTGTTLLLEPTEPGGIEIAKQYKKQLYSLGIPVITFTSADLHKTVDELRKKGVKFQKELTKTEYGYEAVFDDANGNYIQLLEVK